MNGDEEGDTSEVYVGRGELAGKNIRGFPLKAESNLPTIEWHFDLFANDRKISGPLISEEFPFGIVPVSAAVSVNNLDDGIRRRCPLKITKLCISTKES